MVARFANPAVRNSSVLILLGVLPILLYQASAIAADDAGFIAIVSGSVHVQSGTTTIAVTPGMHVQVKDRVVTGADGQVTITLTDDSTLQLGESSIATIEQHAGSATSLDLLGGLLRSIVRHVGSRAPNFEVHTPNAVAAARGTDFDIKYTSNDTRPAFGNIREFTDLRVYSGIVRFFNKGNPAGGIDVKEGYESTVADGLDPSSPASFPSKVSLGKKEDSDLEEPLLIPQLDADRLAPTCTYCVPQKKGTSVASPASPSM